MSIENFNTENTNFIDPQFLLNISDSENLKYSTLLWSSDDDKLSNDFQKVINNKSDVILTDILPDELPSKTTSEEYDFFIKRYLFIPPSLGEENISKKSNTSRDKIILISNPNSTSYNSINNIFKIIGDSKLNEDIIFLDLNQVNFKGILDRYLPQTKKIVILSSDPNLIHYCFLIKIKFDINIFLLPKLINFSSRNLLYGFKFKSNENNNEISIRSLVKDIVFSNVGNLVIDKNCNILPLKPNTSDFNLSLNELEDSKLETNKFFAINQNYKYSFNYSIKECKLVINKYHLNRLQINSILNYIDHFNANNSDNNNSLSNLGELYKIFFISWLNSSISELHCRLLSSFIYTNFKSIEILIKIIEKEGNKDLKKFFFGRLSRILLSTQNLLESEKEKNSDLQKISLKCLELQQRQNSFNQYKFCLDYTNFLKQDNLHNDLIDEEKFIKKEGIDYHNSLNLFSILPFHVPTTSLQSLPIKSLTKTHVDRLVEGILAKNGYSMIEIIWYKALQNKSLEGSCEEFILSTEQQLSEPPWQMIFLSRLIKFSELPEVVFEYSTMQKVLMAFGFKRYELHDLSSELMQSIESKDVKSEIESLYIESLFDEKSNNHLSSLKEKFDILKAFEAKNDRFHPNLYPLLFKLASKRNHPSEKLLKRLADYSSPLFDVQL